MFDANQPIFNVAIAEKVLVRCPGCAGKPTPICSKCTFVKVSNKSPPNQTKLALLARAFPAVTGLRLQLPSEFASVDKRLKLTRHLCHLAAALPGSPKTLTAADLLGDGTEGCVQRAFAARHADGSVLSATRTGLALGRLPWRVAGRTLPSARQGVPYPSLSIVPI